MIDKPGQDSKHLANLELLLDYAEEQSSRVEPTVSPPCLGVDAPDSFPGYGSVRRLGSGGQGVVYEAVHGATNRTVAIKVARESMRRDPSNRVRLSREIEVLSQLRHPNIVRLTDGGEIDGRLYFVTDFIEGKPLDEFLSDRQSSLRETVELFATICEGVNAAHVRGIVHRDLKPSNILVDDLGQPHILDFGLAKLAAPEDGSGVQWEGMTITGQFVGSLPWATPEQVEGDRSRIDIRTDVYALGVVLYQALTGRFPYDVTSSTRTAMNNVLHAEPRSPSLVVPRIDNDLSTIVLKCLSKEPDRRYQSAGELARDLRRYLAHEPIEAKRQSSWYVISRTIRRHRGVSAALALLLVTLVAYAATVTVLLGMTFESRRIAQQSTNSAIQKFRQTRKAVESLIRNASDRLASFSGGAAIQKALLTDALRELQVLVADDNEDPLLMDDLAEVHRGMGDIAQRLRQLDDAEHHLHESLAIRKERAAQEPNDPQRQAALSIAKVRVGDLAKDRGALEEAQEYYEAALRIDEMLVARDGDNRDWLDNLHWSYERMGALLELRYQPATAADYFNKQQEMAERLESIDPDAPAHLLALRSAYGHRLEQATALVNWEEAARYGRRIVEICEKLNSQDPDNRVYLRQLVTAYNGLAPAALRTGNPASAQTYCDKAKSVADRLLRDNREEPDHHYFLARCYSCYCDMTGYTHDFEAHFVNLRLRLEVFEHLVAIAPAKRRYSEELLFTLENLAAECQRRGLTDEARLHTQRALKLVRESLGTPKATPQLLMGHARLLNRSELPDLRDPDEAMRIAEQAVAMTNFQDVSILRQLASMYTASGLRAQALDTLERTLRLNHLRASPLRSALEADLERVRGEGESKTEDRRTP